VKAVLEGWQIPKVTPDLRYRNSIEKKTSEAGIDELYEELKRVDPRAAEKIDRRNVRRMIRALEVFKKTDKQFSELGSKKPPPFKSNIIGLTTDRTTLCRIVDRRVDEMIDGGLVQEVEKLLNMGYDLNLPSMSSIGYHTPY